MPGLRDVVSRDHVITISVDATPALNYLASTVRQLPFATANALNQTAKDVQAAIQKSIAAKFTLRQPRWLLQGVKIEQFVKKSSAQFAITVKLDASRQLLAKFEEGGEKTAGDPNRPIAIPSGNVRPNFQLLPPRGLYPAALGLTPYRQIAGGFKLHGARHVTAHGVVQLKGKQRTFVLTKQMFGVRTGGVYQRIGPGKDDVRLLWTYVSREPIPARPFFYDAGRKAIAENWPKNFNAAWSRALATAR